MAKINPPGVTVKQTTVSAPTTVQSPTLSAVVVGPCMEIVESATSSGSANPTAKLAIPAVVTGTDSGATKNLHSLSVRVSVNGGSDQEVEFAYSPSDASLSASLVATQLDEGISGVVVTKPGNAVTFTTVEYGDSASLLFKKAKCRINFSGSPSARAFLSGDLIVRYSTGVEVAADTIGIVTLVGSGYIIVDTLESAYTLTDAFSNQFGVLGFSNFATATSSKSAYSALGITGVVGSLVSGHSSYRNRKVTVPFSSLPVSRGIKGQLTYDASQVSLSRLQNGVLKRLSTSEAVLRNRQSVMPTTLRKSQAIVPAGAASTATTAVTYTSVPGVNGSAVDVIHYKAIIVTMVSDPAAFVVGRVVTNSTTKKLLGPILAKTSTTLTIGLWGNAAIGSVSVTNVITEVDSGGASLASHGSTVAVVLDVPICDGTESRIVKCTVASTTGLSSTAIFASNKLVAEDSNPITCGTYVSLTATSATILLTGPAPVIGTKLIAPESQEYEITDVVDLTPASAVVVYAGVGTYAAQIAYAVNNNAAAAALVTATVSGDPAGSGVFTTALGLDGTVNRLAPIAVSEGTPALAKVSGSAYDDRDGDSKTPYFWANGTYASYTHGSGSSALTFEAKGGQDLTNVGAYHGTLGNALKVTLVDCPFTTAPYVAFQSDTVIVLYNGVANSSSHTASDIAAAINDSPITKNAVKVTAGGVGVPTGGVLNAMLYGGSDPVNFLAAEDHALIVGQRTAEHFRLIKVTVASVTGFLVGETVKLSNASGAVAGVIREINSSAGVLWIDPVAHAGVLAAGAASAFTLDDHAIKVLSLYVGWRLRLDSGVASGDSQLIATYLANRTGTTAAFSPAPSVSDLYSVVAAAEITYGSVVYGATSAAASSASAVVQPGVLEGDTLTIRADGEGETTVTFSPLTQLDDVVSAINSALGVTAAAVSTDALDSQCVLKLDAATLSSRKGLESILEIGGSAAEKLFGLEPSGLTYTGIHEGSSFKALVGDELEDGTSVLGPIVKIETLTIGGEPFTGARLRINSDTLPVGTSYSRWWLKSRNIKLDAAYDPMAVGGNDRPTPSLVINGAGSFASITQAQSRQSDGLIDYSSSQGVYADYSAVRTDISSGMRTFNDYTKMETAIGPVTPSNPLAWGMNAALLNSGGTAVSCLGVDEVSATYPDGTLDGYRRAMELLEVKDVYFVAPLSQDPDVHDIVVDHVARMSIPSAKKERIALLNGANPTESTPSLAGSGEGTLTDTNVVQIDANDINISDALLTLGIRDALSLSWSDLKAAGVYLQITSNVLRYSVSSIQGDVVTLATANFEPGENSDGFYSATPLTSDIMVTETVSLKVRGVPVSTSTVDGRDLSVTATGLAAAHFASSRVRFVAPGRFGMTYAGSEQSVPGFYYTAALAGQFTNSHPAQPQSRSVTKGFTRPFGSSDIFTADQMDEAAGSGVWWAVQEVENGPVLNRHQLTTDTSSLKTREHSIVVPGDWIAKAARSMVASIPGRENITDQLLSEVSLKLEGLASYVSHKQIAKELAITSIEQSEESPDTLVIAMQRTPLYPCNSIDMTIQT